MNNPFMIGCEVSGESFIGRKEQLKAFQDLLFRNDSKSGSISLTGIHRIGKSSLLYNVMQQNRNKANIYVVRITISKYDDFNIFWKELLSKIKDECEFLEDSANEIRVLDSAIEAAVSDVDDFRRKAEKAFRMISKKYKFIIIIDEFDFAERVFGTSSSNFQFFRELISNADYRMTFITISRRSLYHIETKTFGGSTLDGVFKKISLRGFSNTDLREYFAVFDDHEITMSDESKKKILYYAGRSPYLLSALGQEIINRASAKDIDEVFFACNQQFLDYFKRMLDLLKEEGFYHKLLQIYVGPKFDVKQYDLDELTSRGYISMETTDLYKSINNTEDAAEEGIRYETISEYFVEYLKEISLPEIGGIWPVLSSAEKYLRSLIETVLTRKFGANWKAELEKTNAQYVSQNKRFIDFPKVNRDLVSNKRRYKDRASDNLLTTVGIGELRNILEHYWMDFQIYFNKEQFSKWSGKFDMLYKARNPLAHNTIEYLKEEEIKATELYCQEIIAAIEKNS